MAEKEIAKKEIEVLEATVGQVKYVLKRLGIAKERALTVIDRARRLGNGSAAGILSSMIAGRPAVYLFRAGDNPVIS
jgi:molybdopterin-guanine dinucleotide biosynthesis protein A